MPERGREEAGEQVEQGGLAGAVGADEGVHAALGDVEVDPLRPRAKPRNSLVSARVRRSAVVGAAPCGTGAVCVLLCTDCLHGRRGSVGVEQSQTLGADHAAERVLRADTSVADRWARPTHALGLR